MVIKMNGDELVIKKSSIGWSKTIHRTQTKRPFALFVNDKPVVDETGRIRTFAKPETALRGYFTNE
jgi:hypothetical protein